MQPCWVKSTTSMSKSKVSIKHPSDISAAERSRSMKKLRDFPFRLRQQERSPACSSFNRRLPMMMRSVVLRPTWMTSRHDVKSFGIMRGNVNLVSINRTHRCHLLCPSESPHFIEKVKKNKQHETHRSTLDSKRPSERERERRKITTKKIIIKTSLKAKNTMRWR